MCIVCEVQCIFKAGYSLYSWPLYSKPNTLSICDITNVVKMEAAFCCIAYDICLHLYPPPIPPVPV